MGGVWFEWWQSQDAMRTGTSFHFYPSFEWTSDVVPSPFQIGPSDRYELEIAVTGRICYNYICFSRVTASQMNQDADCVSFARFDFEFCFSGRIN